jgi:arsenite methyltransferase
VGCGAVKDSGKVIGIDMTDEMFEKVRINAKKRLNLETSNSKKGDIERGIPIEESDADVINLTLDKVAAFK